MWDVGKFESLTTWSRAYIFSQLSYAQVGSFSGLVQMVLVFVLVFLLIKVGFHF